jgi:hypothetical protein
MKLWTKLLVPVLMLGLVGIADAKGKHSKGITGKIVSIDGTTVTIQPKGKKGAVADPIKVTTDASTTVEIDSAPNMKVTDLQTGEKVVVTGGTSGPATDIKATTKKHKKKNK